jgi:uncharacterized protein (TIGR03663 family)
MERPVTARLHRAGPRELAFAVGLLLLLGAGLWLRLCGLGDKPLHYDEGVNGRFTLELYWWNQYRYQPDDYHGPLLYYGNLLWFWLLGPGEVPLRMATAVSGALVPLALAPARRFTRDAGVLAAGLLLAVGPGLVYFSRTAIHEIHLVLFTAVWAVALARFAAAPGAGSAATAGLAAGLCFATKETALISAGCLGAGAGLAWLGGVARDVPGETDLFGGRSRAAALRAWTLEARRAWLVAAAVFAAVIAAFFSSFGSHGRGVADFFAAYGHWLGYGIGGRDQAHHVGYFATVAAATEGGARPLALAAAAWACATRQRLGLALAGWAGSALAVYSLLPYKTPWCVLQIDLPVFLLAGWGAGEAWRLARDRGRARSARAAAALAGAACLAPAPPLLAHSLADNRAHFDDASRPYVYHQTFAGFHEMLRDLFGAAEHAQARAPGGPRVVNVGLEFPLSFYTATRGWWPQRTLQLEQAPSPEQLEGVEIVLTDHTRLDAMRSAALAAGGAWHEERYFHRPGIYAFALYRRELWERYRAAGGRASSPWPRPPLRPLPAPPR